MIESATLAPPQVDQRSMTIVVFSGDMDKLLAAMSIASTAAAMGVHTSLFFTFWGISALRKRKSYGGKPILQRMLNTLLPAQANKLSLSRKNMLGAGPTFFRQVMKRSNVSNVHKLVETARSAGVRFVVCTMSMEVMGIRSDELIDGLEFGGAAGCVRDLMRSKSSLFI